MGPEFRDKPQLDLLAHMPPRDIAHGTRIPISLFEYYLSRSGRTPILLELGASTGDRATSLQQHLKAFVLAIEINPDAVKEAKTKPIFVIQGDARRVDFENTIAAILWIESFGGVYSEGLLCNQWGDDWKRVLTTMHIALAPEGYCFISDVARCDRYNESVAQFFSTSEAYAEYRERWRRRYRENAIAQSYLGMPIDYGSFMVTKPGTKKDNDIEWGNAEELVRLYKSDQFERWARHIDSEEVSRFMVGLGMKEMHNESSMWYSRIHKPLAGFIAVWQKGPLYQYHPVYRGLTEVERVEAKEFRQSITRRKGYFRWWKMRLSQNLPEAKYYFPSLFDMK